MLGYVERCLKLENETQVNRAYSLLTVKSVAEDSRTITGIATTPTPDRMGDVVEPDGAEFKLPMPLLWQHNSSQPIGHVIRAKTGPAGIEITAQLVKMDEPGPLQARLDEAWQSIKSGLVQGLSIGFRALESARIADTFSMRFTKWLWLELSAVTIPANAEATIQTVKSLDAELIDKANGINSAGAKYASSLISSGKVNKTASWSFTAADGNALLGANGDDWAKYGKHFLGVDLAAASNTKAYWKYPFAKGNTIYRSALTAIRQRAGQQNDQSIFIAAGRLLTAIDKPKSVDPAALESDRSKVVYLSSAVAEKSSNIHIVKGIYR